jgi:prepilin-type processing-associated H-X9-DG protein
MGTMQLTCPHCKKDVSFDEIYRGKIVQCTNCLNDFPADGPATAGGPVISGSPQPRIRQQQQSPPENCGMAIGSFVTGLLGISPVGLVLGIISLNRINSSNGQLTGKWMAITGIVLSSFALIMIPIMAAILFPVFAKARMKARETTYVETCLSNQRQMAAAMIMYAQDHENTFPPDKTVWTDINVDPAILICPTADKSKTISYGYNKGMSKLTIQATPEYFNLMLTADGGNAANQLTGVGDMQFRHLNQCAASYVDGHAAMVTKESMQPNIK